MRPQDRLLAQLPTRHAHVARYVVRELELVPPWFDSLRVVEALQGLAGSPEGSVASQAALALHRFHPAHLRWQYALPDRRPGPPAA